MKFRKLDIIWFILLILICMVSVSEIDDNENEINKMMIDLNNTGKLLTTQIKENQTIYIELNEIIELNNHLQNLDKSNPETLIKMVCGIYDVDYVLALAIAKFETANFTSDIYTENKNIGGMRLDGEWMYFNSLIEGVNRYVLNLKNNYINQGLTTPELMQEKYCPSNDGGKIWLKQVKLIIEEIKEK